MCLPKSEDAQKAPVSPWRRLRQHVKPKLSRAVVSNAKINLNKYWAKFEHLSSRKIPLMSFVLDPPTSSDLDNEINDNIANEIIMM